MSVSGVEGEKAGASVDKHIHFVVATSSISIIYQEPRRY